MAVLPFRLILAVFFHSFENSLLLHNSDSFMPNCLALKLTKLILYSWWLLYRLIKKNFESRKTVAAMNNTKLKQYLRRTSRYVFYWYKDWKEKAKIL